MIAMGFRWEHWKKSKYFDGDDHDDVIQYSQKTFIPFLDNLKPAIVQWNSNVEMSQSEHPPSENKIVLLF